MGGIAAAVYVPTINALFKTTLPTSGTITLAQIEAQQPNVLTGFPPGGNLSMGGYQLQNTTIGWYDDLSQTKTSRTTFSAFLSGNPNASSSLFGYYVNTQAMHVAAISCRAQTVNVACGTNPVFEVNVNSVDQGPSACTLVSGTCSATFTSIAVGASQGVQFDVTTPETGCSTAAANVVCTAELTTD